MHTSSRFVVVLVGLLAAGCAAQPALVQLRSSGPLLAPIYGDHMVVQRDETLPVRGLARPAAAITVSMAGRTVTTVAGPDGTWQANVPPLQAGGPHTLVVTSDDGTEQVVTDVLVGDVYLCSGQSNMEWTVGASINAEADIARSSNDQIRMLKVPLAASLTPADSFAADVRWEAASPETVPAWSGVCYFFARDLHPEIQVPIGLINASWGGSDIRAWMSTAALQAVGGYETELALLEQYVHDPTAAQASFGELWEDWWHSSTGSARGGEPWQPASGENWPEAPPELGDWKRWRDADLQRHVGMVWHRATFSLTKEQASQPGTLLLGGIDEVDQTWVNGQAVGNTFGWGTYRTYDVPAAVLRAGENVVVVNILNTWGDGGLVGDPAARGFVPSGSTDTLRFAVWRYEPVPLEVGFPPRTPWESIGGRTTLYNAMIAPIGPLPMTGVLWYQGESNTAEGLAYEALMRSLIAQWRDQFGPDAGAFIVQLANYGPPHEAPSESGWAEVREAQRRAVHDDPRGAHVVTIDIGDPNDIHPRNKQEVGRRLARAARAVLYGADVSPSGPLPAYARRTNEGVEVVFDDVDGTLSSRTPGIAGFELCGARPGTCRFADAVPGDDRIVLSGEGDASAERVRYCWADSPTCTLHDAAGLPVGPFELSIDD